MVEDRHPGEQARVVSLALELSRFPHGRECGPAIRLAPASSPRFDHPGRASRFAGLGRTTRIGKERAETPGSGALPLADSVAEPGEHRGNLEPNQLPRSLNPPVSCAEQ